MAWDFGGLNAPLSDWDDDDYEQIPDDFFNDSGLFNYPDIDSYVFGFDDEGFDDRIVQEALSADAGEDGEADFLSLPENEFDDLDKPSDDDDNNDELDDPFDDDDDICRAPAYADYVDNQERYKHQNTDKDFRGYFDSYESAWYYASTFGTEWFADIIYSLEDRAYLLFIGGTP